MKKISIIVFSFAIFMLMLFLSSCTKFGNYKVSSIDTVGYVGKVSYVTVKYLNPLNQPANATVKIEMFDETQSKWKDFTDALSGQKTFKTDETGNIAFSILPKKAGTYRFRLLNIADNTTSPVEFSVDVRESMWGFLIWLAADNDLEIYSQYDLEEMKMQNPDVFLMVMQDNYYENDSIMFLDENGDFKKLEVFETDVNSGDPEFLKEILEMFYSFDVEKKSLVIWNHGNAWVDDSNYNLAVGYDFTKQDALTTKEIKETIEYINDEYNTVLELLGFDACNMGTIEIAYEFKDCAKYFAASAFTEPAFGWNYTFLSSLNQASSIYDLAKGIVDSYFEFYGWLGYMDVLSLGVYDLSGIQYLVNEISELSNKLLELLGFRSDLKDLILDECHPYLLQYYPVDDVFQMIDILDFLNVLSEKTNDSDIYRIKVKVLDILYNSLLVYKKTNIGNFWSTGLGIFFPNSIDIYQNRLNDMSELDFYKDNPWKDFLAELLNDY